MSKEKKNDWQHRIFDSLSYPTLIINSDKIILDVNKIFLKKHGNKKNLIGNGCNMYFFGTDKPCPAKICPIPKIFNKKKGHSDLIKGNYKGNERWEERIFTPIFNEAGDVIYIRLSIRDVTKVKALEQELKGVKNLIEKVVQSSASGIVAADSNGNILLMNEAAEKLFGYSYKKLVKTKTVKDFYPPGLAKNIMKKLRSESYGGKGKLINTKIDIINSKGEKIPGEIAAAIIYEGEKEVATMGIYTDLREKLAVEKELEKTQKCLLQSEKMASIGQLAAGVAHEINNPLTGILFHADMALGSRDEDDPIKEDLKLIIEDVNRCKEIVKDLLIYSRQTTPSKEYLQLNELINKSLSLIHDQKLFGNIKIEKQMAKEPMLIHVDRNHFNQVIINLIINAGDAMEGKGKLTLRTYSNMQSNKACFEITDTGHGISQDSLPNIFDPFFSTKELGKGTGLGLSTVYAIIEKNEGLILVKNTGPKGTTFLIELPLHAVQ